MIRPSLLAALTLAAVLAPLRPLGAQATPAPQAFQGVWTGVLEAGAAKLRLVFHVAVGAGGVLSGTMDSPDQGAAGIPATSVTAQGSTLSFAVANLGMTYEGTLSADGTRLEGTFTQGPARLPLALSRGEAPPPPERPQHPKPPFPYREEEVRITNAAPGVVLAGTLTLPQGAGPFPGVVLVTGSGPQDRDESLMGHKPFLVLADHLTRKGIAVLRYDDRGVGKSTGSFSTATSEDFAGDALAAVAFLGARPEVGPVGIAGHSEGGLIGPLAAVRSDDVAFVVMLAGPGLPGEQILYLQGNLIARAGGASEAQAAAVGEMQHALQETVATLPAETRREMEDELTPAAVEAQVRQVNSPWFRFFLTYDPRPTLEKVRVPVLALNGSLDLQVPAEANLREVGEALRRGGNGDVTTRLLPGLNHLFQTARTGGPSEYATITETMSPTALEAVSSWILERFAPRR
ncbi:MAG TPA: alpha/beta hydrolase [Longimicrobiales bacterium]|nr:alpha/beta hydrolase [Longimicrobiales bacterium]